MTYEELKAEAEKHGYKLTKNNPMPKKLPCICGSNKRQTWYSPDGVFLACRKCGLRGEAGKSNREAIENWNRRVTE